jgi:hypothetical protein
MEIYITKYCQISNKRFSLNGSIVFENNEAANFSEFIRCAYKFAGMAYPKFYKMDNPCKLAVVAAELLLKETGIIEKYGKDQVGVVLQNSSSTIDTDHDFQLTIDDRANYFPSPAVFVYTLPNIMIGEICIRHKIFGENALFIEPGFNAEALSRHIDLLFEEKRVRSVIAGWVEQNKEDYDAFLYLAECGAHEKYGTCQPHHADRINLLMKKNNNK